jgi:hypothetical protein
MKMKKTYISPVTEIVEIRSAEFMVPDQMSDPSVNIGANNYAFGEEEDEEDIDWCDRFDNYGTCLWN